ncbi:collagen-binding domain-containing protein [Streptomyces sp. NPDC056488]|uniref:collagen-binding domain-containing protein n=1 Tax=unclassified Streptomyces TaxID=2593676 RepID=UPI0036C5AC3E
MSKPLLASAVSTVCAVGLAAVAFAFPASGAAVPVSLGNPVDGNEGFGAFIQNDALLGSTESEGPVAVGGNLAFGQGYNVALRTPGNYTPAGDARPAALLVGGRVLWDQSAPGGILRVLSDGYVKIGDTANATVRTTDSNGASVSTRVVPAGRPYDTTPRIELTARQPQNSVTAPGLIDFDAAFTAFRDRSDTMATCAQNVVLTDANGTPLAQPGIAPGTQAYVTLAPGTTNVLHVTGADLSNLASITFRNQPTATTPLVVDVDTTATGGTFDWHTPNTPGISGNQAPYVLWNFADATSITMTGGDSLEGTIYAPRARLEDDNPTNIEGDIIAREFAAGTTGAGSTAGEIHHFPFAANVSCDTQPTTPTTTPPVTVVPPVTVPPVTVPPVTVPPVTVPPITDPPVTVPPVTVPPVTIPPVTVPPTTVPPTAPPTAPPHSCAPTEPGYGEEEQPCGHDDDGGYGDHTGYGDPR